MTYFLLGAVGSTTTALLVVALLRCWRVSHRDASQTSASVDARPDERAPEVSAQKDAP